MDAQQVLRQFGNVSVNVSVITAETMAAANRGEIQPFYGGLPTLVYFTDDFAPDDPTKCHSVETSGGGAVTLRIAGVGKIHKRNFIGMRVDEDIFVEVTVHFAPPFGR